MIIYDIVQPLIILTKILFKEERQSVRASEVIIPPLHGAASISVIVEKGVRVHGVQLHSHNDIYYMDGIRTFE
ncbi:hypothetical protein MHK_005661 [Candidatus Magnetomorum sp. HK-1]|nr:hypothetical protein MHK_005661 [Candidatus Magnetomorum sp. HK-1]